MRKNFIDNLKLSYLRLKFYLLIYTKFRRYNYQNYQPYKSIDTEKTLIDLKNNGYCIIENYLNLNECEIIKSNIDNYLKLRKNIVWSDELKSDCRIYGFNHLCELTKKIFFSSELLEISNKYINCKMETVFTMANKLSFVENNDGSGGGWHRDGINPSLKSLIYIDDVGIDNGPLQLILHSNKFKNIILDNKKMQNEDFLNTRFKNEQISKIDNIKYRLIQFYLKRGSMIIFDSSHIHRGKPIKNGNRYAITNYYFPIGKMTQKKYHVRPQVFN
tara:strand:+ start:11744 stop:12565 length:822 start_codon:yes stop_codon:yes gene_type:complete